MNSKQFEKEIPKNLALNFSVRLLLCDYSTHHDLNPLLYETQMNELAKKYPPWKRILHKFQKRRDIPFRKRFFVGYDLHGNTYWEFTPDGNMLHLRRKLEPYQETIFKADYAPTIPPQWLQWLRRTRDVPPTLQELIDDQLRQERIKILAKQADERWKLEKERLEYDNELKLRTELDRVEAERKAFDFENQKLATQEVKEPNQSKGKKNPWAASEKSAKEYPIESASIKPRK